MESDDRILDVLRNRDEGNGTRVGFAYRSAASVLTSVADVRGNVNYSPASLWIVLAMAAQCAHGRTLEQLAIRSASMDWMRSSTVCSSHRSTVAGRTPSR